MVRPRSRFPGGIRSCQDQRLMLRAIDEAFGNFSRAREIYRDWMLERSGRRGLPPRSVPDRREFQRLEERFSDQLHFSNNLARHHDAGRPRVNWRIEKRVIALARSHPVMGLRRIAQRTRISHMTVRRIIREEGLRPYRVRHVQALQPQDYRTRRKFCRWMLRKMSRDPHFLERILFTDESSFSSTGILNRQNIRIWADRNPHAMIERISQGRFAVNVWAGIIGQNIIGPIFLPDRLNSTVYLSFIRGELMARLRRIFPRENRNRVFFMHDGAPPHYGIQVRQFLDTAFGTRWIGRRPAPHIWPPRSPDLNPLDFFFWGTLKNIVYQSSRAMQSAETLRTRIREGVSTMMGNEEVLRKVRENLEERLRACLRNNGGHIEAGEQARMLRAIDAHGTLFWERR